MSRMSNIVYGSAGVDPNTPIEPKDLPIAYRIYEANCGPASFAALMGSLILDILCYFPHFPKKPYTTIPQMRQALEISGANFWSNDDWPDYGLCLIQLDGKWTARRQFHEAAKHRHWVAVNDGMVYDINSPRWIPKASWENHTMPHLVEANSGCEGWHLSKVFAISRLKPEYCPPYVGSLFAS